MSARTLTTTCTLTLAALLLAGNAQAQTINEDRIETARERASEVGRALGRIETPTFSEAGSLELVLYGAQDEGAYLVDASLSAFLALVRAPQGAQISMGGVYGELHRLASDGSVEAESSGYVAGTWRMQSADQGDFEALIHRRTPGGGTEVGGLLRGTFSLIDGASEIWIGGPPSEGPASPSVDATSASGGAHAGGASSVPSDRSATGSDGSGGGVSTSATQTGGMNLANGRSERDADEALDEPHTELPQHRSGYASARYAIFD